LLIYFSWVNYFLCSPLCRVLSKGGICTIIVVGTIFTSAVSSKQFKTCIACGWTASTTIPKQLIFHIIFTSYPKELKVYVAVLFMLLFAERVVIFGFCDINWIKGTFNPAQSGIYINVRIRSVCRTYYSR